MHHSFIPAAAVTMACASVVSAEPISFSGTGVITDFSGTLSGYNASLDAATVGTSFTFSLVIDSDAMLSALSTDEGNVYLNSILSISYDFGAGNIFEGATPIPDQTGVLATQSIFGPIVDVLTIAGGYTDSSGVEIGANLVLAYALGAFPDFNDLGTGATAGEFLSAFDLSQRLDSSGGASISVFDPQSRESASYSYEVSSLSVTMGSPVVPLPSVAGLGLVGLAGVASRRRRPNRPDA